MIYYAIKEDEIAYLLSIYYKKDDKRVLSNDGLKQLVEKYCL